MNTKHCALSVILLFCVFFLSFSTLVHAQQSARIPGDFADPSVIAANGKYYSIGTSSEWAPHFPIYSSSDLRDWKQEGYLFEKAPEWAGSSFWAPEYFYHNGVYYVYYSAKRKEDGVSCIGVASSKYPDHGFVDHGIVVAYGTESIDAYVVKQGDDLFMTWKAYGLDDRSIEILGSKMSSDGMSLEGEPFTLLKDTDGVGIEGQSFVKKDGYFYMFYSLGACCGPGCDYRVQAARSKTLEGPYEQIGETVLLGENQGWKCMGHGTFVHDQHGKEFYVYHGYSKDGTVNTGRQGLLAELVWSDSGIPSFEVIPQTDPIATDLNVNFQTKDSQKLFWQWDFKYSTPSYRSSSKGLTVSSKVSSENKVGASLTLRPSTSSYSFSTQIDKSLLDDDQLQGLVVYGDHNNAIGVGVEQKQVTLWRVHEGKFESLGEIPLDNSSERFALKIAVNTDNSCAAFVRFAQDGVWKQVPANEASLFSLNGLAPWDRSPRFGLHVSGNDNVKGSFLTFTYNSETTISEK